MKSLLIVTLVALLLLLHVHVAFAKVGALSRSQSTSASTGTRMPRSSSRLESSYWKDRPQDRAYRSGTLRRRLKPFLVRTFDDAWKTAGGTTTDVHATTLESYCIKGSGKSGSKSGSKRYCSDGYGSSKGSKSSKSKSYSSSYSSSYDNSYDDSYDGSGYGDSPSYPSYPSPSAPSPTGNQEPSQPSQPSPSAPSPPSNPGNPLLDRSQICGAYFAGEAPTDGPSSSVSTEQTLQLERSADVEGVLIAFTQVLNSVIAPDVLGCSATQEGRRYLQETDTILTNLEFSNAFPEAQSNCNAFAPSVNCVTTSFDADANYVGIPPDDLEEQISASIERNKAAFADIPGWLGFASDTPPDEDDPGSSNTPSPTPDDAVPIVVTRSSGSDDPLSAGGYVGVAAAGLVLILIMLFACRARRGRGMSDSEAMKHRQFTADDESDGYHDDNETKEDDDRLVHVVNEDNSILTGSYQNDMLLYDSQRVGDDQGLQDMATQRGESDVNFVAPDAPPKAEVALPSNAERTYLSNDTVML